MEESKKKSSTWRLGHFCILFSSSGGRCLEIHAVMVGVRLGFVAILIFFSIEKMPSWHGHEYTIITSRQYSLSATNKMLL